MGNLLNRVIDRALPVVRRLMSNGGCNLDHLADNALVGLLPQCDHDRDRIVNEYGVLNTLYLLKELKPLSGYDIYEAIPEFTLSVIAKNILVECLQGRLARMAKVRDFESWKYTQKQERKSSV